MSAGCGTICGLRQTTAVEPQLYDDNDTFHLHLTVSWLMLLLTELLYAEVWILAKVWPRVSGPQVVVTVHKYDNDNLHANICDNIERQDKILILVGILLFVFANSYFMQQELKYPCFLVGLIPRLQKRLQ
jgi:hypothetical protein